ncbi:hypothetical protein GL180_16975 [Vibrio toranzoniae]|nr:hypothetical protein [Vibrio toranzoniae]
MLGLPQFYVAAGFVRNLAWEHLDGYASPTSLNDIDMIFFGHIDTSYELNLRYENQLKQ